MLITALARHTLSQNNANKRTPTVEMLFAHRKPLSGSCRSGNGRRGCGSLRRRRSAWQWPVARSPPCFPCGPLELGTAAEEETWTTSQNDVAVPQSSLTDQSKNTNRCHMGDPSEIERNVSAHALEVQSQATRHKNNNLASKSSMNKHVFLHLGTTRGSRKTTKPPRGSGQAKQRRAKPNQAAQYLRRPSTAKHPSPQDGNCATRT